jgi:LPLT family lysophospholipid transporter-like MFS transporter
MRTKRNFPLLLGSQFLSAFGDNAMLAVILGQLTFQRNAGQLTDGQLGAMNALYTSLFFVPYVVLAPLAGFLNDRYAKTSWLLGGNAIKLAGTAVAGLSLWLGGAWQGLGYFLVGIGGCIYSPAKYGVLPEIVERERLVKANGLTELLTVVAILTGFVGGAGMIDTLPVPVCYLLLMGIFGVSLGLNACMARTPAHRLVEARRSVDEFFGNLGNLLESGRLFRVLCGTGLFWFCGAVLKMNFQPWGLNVIDLANRSAANLYVNTRISLYVVWLTLGIVAGSLLAGQLHRVGDLRSTRRYGWALAGLIEALGLVELLLGAEFIKGQLPIVLTLIAMGTIAGCFLIPLNAALQSECNQTRLGKTIAAQNFIDNLAMVTAGALVFVANRASIRPSGIFLCLAALVALVVTGLRVPSKQDTGPTAAEEAAGQEPSLPE